MVEEQPMFLTNLCYTAADFREQLGTLVAIEGVGPVGGSTGTVRTSLQVTTGAAVLNLSVNTGHGFVADDLALGLYQILNNPTPLTVTATPADPTNPRIDTVVATVRDSDAGGTDDDWIVQVVAGTPTVGATLANLNGAAAVPVNSLLLAHVLVPAGFAGPFVDATHILDERRPYVAGGDKGVYYTRFQRATNQSLADSTSTTITFPVTATGTTQGNDWLTESAGVVTIKRAGVYRLTGTVEFAANATGYRQAGFLVNGVAYGVPTTVFSGQAVRATRVPVTADISIGPGDTLSLSAIQNSGGALNASAADLTVTRVGTLVP